MRGGLMSFQNGICLTLKAYRVLDCGVLDVLEETFDYLETNMDGLREFFRNVDTVHIQCSALCAKELHQCDYNAGRVFLYREFPWSLKVDEGTISGWVYIKNSDYVLMCLRKSLNLPYDNLITNFKIINK